MSSVTTASMVVETCVVCGGPLSAKRVIIDDKVYHEGCCFKSHPPHTWADYSALSDQLSLAQGRIQELQAISDRTFEGYEKAIARAEAAEAALEFICGCLKDETPELSRYAYQMAKSALASSIR